MNDWLLWVDWCQVTGADPHTPTDDLLVAWCRFAPCQRSLRYRRLRNILTTACHRYVTSSDKAQEPIWDDWAPLLVRLPIFGFPGGIRGRRDRFVVTLAGHGLTRREVQTLTPTDLTPTDLTQTAERSWLVASRTIRTGDDPLQCGACAVSDWLRVLSMLTLGGRAEAQQFLVPERPVNHHTCQDCLDDLRWRNAYQLVPAVDRWGWITDWRPMSKRSLTEAVSRARHATSIYLPPTAQPTAPLPVGADVDLDEWDARYDEIAARIDAILARTALVCRKQR